MELDHFVSRFHAHATRDSNARLHLGVDRDLGELPDPSLEEVEARTAEAGRLLAELEAIDRAHLGFDERLDLDLARLTLELEVHRSTLRFNGATTAEQMPDAGDDIGDGLIMLWIRDNRPDGDRLADVTSRLEAVPDYLETHLERLGSPVERWRAIDAAKCRGLGELLSGIVAWAESVGWPELPRLGTAREKAVTAIDGYVRRLETLPVVPGFHVGDEAARRLVALRGIEQPFEELHGVARDFLAENAATVEDLRARLVSKYHLDPETTADAVAEVLQQRFRVDVANGDFDVVLGRYRAELDGILRFIDEHGLFPIPDGQEIRILRTPPFLAPTIPAGAMVSPAPFREGMKRSLVYLTLSEELLPEHTTIRIPGLMLHEGIPGHHLQLTWAALHPSTIRRHANAMDQAEGWTTMLEDYMLDRGLMGDLTDEARFAAKREIARIGARVAIDLFFMTGDRGYLDVGVEADLTSGDPFVSAGSLLQKVTGFTPGRTQGELNWYSRARGYPLSYLTGNRLVWALRRDFERAQSERLAGSALDRAFHEAFLDAGAMPVAFLRRVFEAKGLVERRAPSS